jgi:hypothetical protein
MLISIYLLFLHFSQDNQGKRVLFSYFFDKKNNFSCKNARKIVTLRDFYFYEESVKDYITSLGIYYTTCK